MMIITRERNLNAFKHYAMFDNKLCSLHHLDKAEYRATVIGTDKHKFGYELGENMHFHHTTTGRLGGFQNII